MGQIIKIISSGIFLGIVGGLLLVGTAYAHAAYLRSIPAADTVIAASPPRVEIWFKQEVLRRKGENSIVVTNAGGQVVSLGDTSVDDDDRTHILVSLQAELPPGTYTVNWKNTSLEDGHPEEGSFVFTVDPTASPQPTDTRTAPTQQVSPTTPSTPTPINGPCAASLVPVLGLAGFAILRRKRR